MSEICGTSVLFLPWSQKSAWVTYTSLVLRSCPELLLESKSPSLSLSLSISLSLYFSHFPSNNTATRVPLLILEILSQQGEPSKSLSNISLHAMISIPKYSRCSRNSPSVRIDTLQFGPSSPKSSNYQPFIGTIWIALVNCILTGSNLDSEVKIFQPQLNEVFVKNQLSCCRLHKDYFLWICWGCGQAV